MTYSKIIGAALVAILSVLSATAQQTTPQPCQSATPMANLNATLLAGHWYEEVRAPAKNVSCVMTYIQVINNQSLSLTTSYSATQNGLHADQNDKVTINITEINANTGFNISYNGGANTTYKILFTDYNTNAILCGFTNISDTTTSFGLIFTRQQIISNSTWFAEVNKTASSLLTNFNDNTATNITQSTSCYASSAATSVPILATVFAVFYALLKFVY